MLKSIRLIYILGIFLILTSCGINKEKQETNNEINDIKTSTNTNLEVIEIERYQDDSSTSQGTIMANICAFELKNLPNQTLQQNLNQSFLKKAYDKIAFYKEFVKTDDVINDTYSHPYGEIIKFDYEIIRNDDKIFTLCVFEQESRIIIDTYYNINKSTGELISLSDFFKDNENYLDDISMYIVEECEKRNIITTFEHIRMNQNLDNFYINEKGNIVISFPKYAIASGSEGIVEIEIDEKIMQDIINNTRKNTINYEITHLPVNEIFEKISFTNSIYNSELGRINKITKNIQIDLNGDEQKDNVEYLVDGTIEINGIKYKGNFRNSDLVFIDLNNKDRYIEFINVDNSPSDSGGFHYGVYSFDGTELKKIFDIGNYEFTWNSDNGLINATPLIFDSLTSDSILNLNELVPVWCKIENQIITRYISNKILDINDFSCHEIHGPWANKCITVNYNQEINPSNETFKIIDLVTPEKLLIQFSNGLTTYLWQYDQR